MEGDSRILRVRDYLKGKVICKKVKAERGGKSDSHGALVERAEDGYC
jgi:hypothetical protein